MFEIFIEFLLGLISGIFLGITGIPALPLTMLILDYLKINDYKNILGAIMFVNLFPISIGSAWEFYKAKRIDFKMGFIILISIIIGSYYSSKFVVTYKNKLSNKTIKYITSGLGLIVSVLFFISAYYETN